MNFAAHSAACSASAGPHILRDEKIGDTHSEKWLKRLFDAFALERGLDSAS